MRTTEFKDTELGPIPKDWEVKRLGEVAKLQNGYSFQSVDYDSNGAYNIVTISNVQAGIFDIRVSNKIKSLPADIQQHQLLRLGDVLISMTGNVGRVCIVNSVNCLLNQRVGKFRIEKGVVDSEYLFCVLNSNTFLNAMVEKGQGGAQPNIGKKDIEGFALCFPPLPEQRRIAAALGDVDKLIENLKKRVEKKKNLKRGAMQELLTGKRRLKGFTGVWVEKRLGEMATIARGGSPRPIQAWLTDSVDGVNWVKIGDVSVGAKYITSTEERIVPAGASFSREVKPGDFILSNSMSFGRPYILKIGGCIHDGWLAIQEYSAAFDTEYLYYILSSDNVFRQYVAMAAGSSVKNLNKEKVSDVKISLPPLPEQRAIAAVLSDMDAEIANLEHKLKKMTLLKQGMMQDLLTGKVRLT